VLPIPGEQFVQLGGGMIGDAAQHVCEPGLWDAAIAAVARDGDMMLYLVILLKGQTFLPRIG
jgi:hypothetical protein